MKIRGREVSEETADLALREYFAKHPELEYWFQAGDMVENRLGKRIIVRLKDTGEVASFDLGGVWQSIGQEEFVENDYKKIGVIRDFFKET